MTRLPTLVRRLHPARPMTRPMWMLLALLALAGCKQKVRILNPNVPRNPIVFESPEGADAFDTALDERYDRGDADIKPVKGRLSKNAVASTANNATSATTSCASPCSPAPTPSTSPSPAASSCTNPSAPPAARSARDDTA